MSGILSGIAISNNFDANGQIMSGAMLRIWDASTGDVVTAYKDSALTAGQEHPWPIVAGASGRIPMFWLADGFYRVRLSSSDGGYVAYDYSSIGTIASSGASTDDGDGGDTVQAVFVGAVWAGHRTDEIDGWVRANGRTIGSASSGASELAHADAAALFAVLWDDNNLDVSGGRGASSTEDFAANKALTLPDYRGRVPAGIDGMGNSPSGRLTGATFTVLTPTTLGAVAGAQTVALDASTMPAHAHTLHLTDPGHAHSYTGPDGNTGATAGAGTGTTAHAAATTGNAGTGITVTMDSTGGNASHNNVQPTILTTYYLKL